MHPNETYDRPRFPIGVNALIVKDGKILLGHRMRNGELRSWGLIGGHLEYDESMEDCLIRELQEEIGIIPVIYEWCNVVNDIRDKLHIVQVGFLVAKWSGEIKNLEPDKCKELKWFSLDELPEDIVSGHRAEIFAMQENISFKEVLKN